MGKSFLMPSATPQFNVGMAVQYLSITNHAWAETRVIAKHITGAIMIECEPEHWIEALQVPSLVRRSHDRQSIVHRGLDGFGLGDKCLYSKDGACFEAQII